MLEVKGLTVEISKKEILKDINFNIRKGEAVVLFGPNGSGKSTLIRTIMGFAGHLVKKGLIMFKGENILGMPIEERVRLGLGIMYQHPPKIRGVKLSQIARFLCDDESKIGGFAEKLLVTEHLNRDVNLNYSGGEMKRSELFQLMLQNPDLLLLDEPESGVDLENISVMGQALEDYLKQEGKSALVITHTGYILDYIKAERGFVMIDGKVWCSGNPKEMFESIKETGYEKCKVCECPQKT
ncbi:MAG: ABC transporter ATP-binding protein [Candidatus Omnitrophota bacterium]